MVRFHNRAYHRALLASAILNWLITVGAIADDPFWAVSLPTNPSPGGFATAHREPTVAVGMNRIVQTGNNWVACYDRSGQLQWQARLNERYDCEISANYFWNEVDPDECMNQPDPCSNPCVPFLSTGGIDARVIFDHFSKRFIVIHPEPEDAAGQLHLYLAISPGYDPSTNPNDPVSASAWDFFYVPTQVGNSHQNFHFPGLSVTDQAIYVTTLQTDTINQYGTGGHSLHVFRKPPPGAPPTYYQTAGNYASFDFARDVHFLEVTGANIGLPMPTEVFEVQSTQRMYLAQLFKKKDLQDGKARIRILAVTDPLGSSPTTHEHIFTLADEIRNNAAHLEQYCGDPAIPFYNLVRHSNRNMQNAVYRSGQLYFAVEDDIDDPDNEFDRVAIRWFQVATNGWPAQNQPSIVQEGVLDGGRVFVSPADADAQWITSTDRPMHYMYPYVMALDSGDLALFFTAHSAHGYPMLMWTAHRAGDPAGEMGAARHVMQAGNAGVDLAANWGEYQGVALDPSDGNRAWATGQLGRCCPQEPCNGVPVCTTCSKGGTWQNRWHSAIGSYIVPQGPRRTLVITTDQFNNEPAPPSFTVKVAPTDVQNFGYASLSPDDPSETRQFGDAQQVVLEAPAMLSGSTTFVEWRRDGQFLSSQNRITITANAQTDGAHLMPVYAIQP